MSDLCPDIEPDSDSSNDGSINEGGKDQDKPEYQEQKEAVLLQSLTLCEGLERPGRKVKESAASMEKIPSTMGLHKNVDGADTIF